MGSLEQAIGKEKTDYLRNVIIIDAVVANDIKTLNLDNEDLTDLRLFKCANLSNKTESYMEQLVKSDYQDVLDFILDIPDLFLSNEIFQKMSKNAINLRLSSSFELAKKIDASGKNIFEPDSKLPLVGIIYNLIQGSVPVYSIINPKIELLKSTLCNILGVDYNSISSFDEWYTKQQDEEYTLINLKDQSKSNSSILRAKRFNIPIASSHIPSESENMQFKILKKSHQMEQYNLCGSVKNYQVPLRINIATPIK